MGKYRDLLPQDIRVYIVKMFYKLEEDEPVILRLHTPSNFWTVRGGSWDDRESAEAYFMKLWEEENAKGNASEIEEVTKVRYREAV